MREAPAGWALATGDLNGDGFDDVVVGGPEALTLRGGASAYLGGPAGLGAAPAWIVTGPDPTGYFGASVGTADVNGDGYGDVVVSAPWRASGRGGFFVYHGGPTGPASTATLSLTGAWPDADQGSAIAGAGDVDGDGYEDVIVGSYRYTHWQELEGRVQLFRGSAAGLIPTPSWSYEGNQSVAFLGRAVAGAGDVDGDGYDDVIVGMPSYGVASPGDQDGRALLFRGGPAGLELSPSWSVDGTDPNAQLGSAVAGAGDVDGDGYDDVLVGAPGICGVAICDFYYGPSDHGRAWLYRGGPAGLSPAPAWSTTGPRSFDRLGQALAGAGDVNGDGYDDVIIGLPYRSNPDRYEGAASLFLGSATGLAASAAGTVEANQADLCPYCWDTRAPWLGSALAGGDVDGDGFSDVFVGAPGYDDGVTDEGAVFGFRGR